jgi:peroxiredoxin
MLSFFRAAAGSWIRQIWNLPWLVCFFKRVPFYSRLSNPVRKTIMMNRLFFLAFLSFTLAITTFAQNNLRIGSQAPVFSGTLLDGNSVSLYELRGKVVVITFWTTRCIICHHEMPELDRIAGQYSQRDVAFLALPTENQQQVDGYMNRNPFRFQIVPDSFGTLLKYADRDRAGNINIGYPAYFVLDKDARVQHRSSGYDKLGALNSAVGRLVSN